jgi:hypothetical protein
VQPEARFKRKLCLSYETAFPKGWYNYNPAVRKVGVPDLYFSRPKGIPLWVEAKVGSNPLSRIQQITIDRMQAAGNVVVIVTGSMGARMIEPTFTVRRPGYPADATFSFLDAATPTFWVNMEFI